MKKIKIILRAKEKDGTDMHPHTRRQIKKTKHTFKKKGGGGRKRMDGSWIRQLELSHVVGSFRPHPNADWRLSDIAASKSWPALPPVFRPFNPTHLRKPHAPLFPTWSDAKRKRTSTPEQRHSNAYTFDPFWLCLLFPPLFLFIFFFVYVSSLKVLFLLARRMSFKPATPSTPIFFYIWRPMDRFIRFKKLIVFKTYRSRLPCLADDLLLFSFFFFFQWQKPMAAILFSWHSIRWLL